MQILGMSKFGTFLLNYDDSHCHTTQHDELSAVLDKPRFLRKAFWFEGFLDF